MSEAIPPRADRSAPFSPPASAPRSGRGLTLESVPSDDPAKPDAVPNLPSQPRTRTEGTPGPNATRRPGPVAPPSGARGRPGLFGRWINPSLPGLRSPSQPRASISVEPRSDPAADAALKRRIERQIRASVGDRVRFYEVRVVDRDVTIRAKATRFWQRRAVRHALETLPGMTGVHARVEMVD